MGILGFCWTTAHVPLQGQCLPSTTTITGIRVDYPCWTRIKPYRSTIKAFNISAPKFYFLSDIHSKAAWLHHTRNVYCWWQHIGLLFSVGYQCLLQDSLKLSFLQFGFDWYSILDISPFKDWFKVFHLYLPQHGGYLHQDLYWNPTIYRADVGLIVIWDR